MLLPSIFQYWAREISDLPVVGPPEMSYSSLVSRVYLTEAILCFTILALNMHNNENIIKSLHGYIKEFGWRIWRSV